MIKTVALAKLDFIFVMKNLESKKKKLSLFYFLSREV